MVKFFSSEEEQRIIETIRRVEQQTSGEVRVHLSADAGDDIMRAAQETFARLDMQKTEERNGVLFFLAPRQHQFAIIGDEGIDRRVPPHFWEDVRDLAQGHFRQGDFAAGVCAALDRIGEKLKAFFPYRSDDRNELPDELSYDSED